MESYASIPVKTKSVHPFKVYIPIEHAKLVDLHNWEWDDEKQDLLNSSGVSFSSMTQLFPEYVSNQIAIFSTTQHRFAQVADAMNNA